MSGSPPLEVAPLIPPDNVASSATQCQTSPQSLLRVLSVGILVVAMPLHDKGVVALVGVDRMPHQVHADIVLTLFV